MGGKGSKAQSKGIDYDEWETTGQIFDAKIMKSKSGRGEAELNHIVLDPRYDISREEDIYAYRQNTDNSFVKCYASELNTGKKTTLCGNEKNCKVLTERIPKRWNQIPQISFPESIYALSESLSGYEELYEKAGAFQISPTMMGVNKKGQMKVWLNQNFANNHPSDERPILQTTGSQTYQYGTITSQSSMIRNIIDLIEQKCENGKFPQDFKNIIDKNSQNFDSIQNSIEDYAVTNRMFIPSKLNQAYLEGANTQVYNIDTYNNSNIIKHQSNTNRFTYQPSQKYESNIQQNQRYTVYNTTNDQEKRQRQNNFLNRPYTYQSNSYQRNYAQNPNSQLEGHIYTYNGGTKKRYTFVESGYKDINGQKMKFQTNQFKTENEPLYRNPEEGSKYRYTTYEHNREVPDYQGIQTSQVIRHY